MNQSCFLQAQLEPAERNNTHLEKEIEEIKVNSVAENMVFTCADPNYQGAEGENCVELVRNFLMSTLGITEARKFKNKVILPLCKPWTYDTEC